MSKATVCIEVASLALLILTWVGLARATNECDSGCQVLNDVNLTYTNNGDTTTFSLAAPLSKWNTASGWMAVAVSTDSRMVNNR